MKTVQINPEIKCYFNGIAAQLFDGPKQKTTVDTEEAAAVEIDFDGGSQSQNTPKGQKCAFSFCRVSR